MEGFSRKVVSGLRKTDKVVRYRDPDEKDAGCLLNLLGTDNYRLSKVYAERNLVPRLTGASHPGRLWSGAKALWLVARIVIGSVQRSETIIESEVRSRKGCIRMLGIRYEPQLSNQDAA
jgi:hypothetical protein